MSEWERKAEEFTEKIAREFYLTGSGQKEKLEIEPIYRQYADLFSEENVRERLMHLHDDPPATRYLAGMAASGFVENQVKELDQDVTNAILAAKVDWDGEEVPFLQVPVLLANEEDWQRRHKLESLSSQVDAELLPRLRERLERVHEIAETLGFEDYVQMYKTLLDVDLDAQAQWLQKFLDETEEEYKRQLFDRLQKAGIPEDEATSADIAFILRAKEFDRYFEKDRMVPALLETLKAAGLSKGEDLPFTLDLEPRPLKSPRAFCSPVKVPEEVYLVIKPHGGRDDWDSFFHEAGHAEHFSHIPKSLPFPVRVLGDSDLIEVYSFHMQYRLLEPSWVRDIVGIRSPDLERYLSLSRFAKLFLLRRYVAKLQYEVSIHRGNVENAGEIYKATLEQALHIHIAPERALRDMDDGFYTAMYLRAWLFEAMLREFLRKELGETWWRHPDAGDLLYQWWQRGQTKTLNDLLPEIGHTKLEMEPLIHDVLGLE